jgi:splicing factor 3A subunit 2
VAQNRVGSKFGGGGVAGASESNVDRRERLRKLALETIDLAKVSLRTAPHREAASSDQRWFMQDPYILRNHLGGLECRLCLTLHTNEGSYLAHTQISPSPRPFLHVFSPLFLWCWSDLHGKKHQTNLARRAARDAKDTTLYQAQLLAQQAAARAAAPKKQFIKIGSPGYQVTKVKDPVTGQQGLLFQVHYPQIKEDVRPRHRFMSPFEQHAEAADRRYQYLLVRITFSPEHYLLCR